MPDAFFSQAAEKTALCDGAICAELARMCGNDLAGETCSTLLAL